MKQKIRLFVAAAFMTVLFSITAFAAGWSSGKGEDSGRWWYDLGNGNWYTGTQGKPSWQWLDGNGDGVAECYAFDENGWMYAGTRTPDGYAVNEDGAWTENGAVQTRKEGLSVADPEADRNVLVVYFSRTNTTERAANLIHQQTGGTLFEIHPAEDYPGSYSATTERAQREIRAGTLPAMTGDVENFENYDVVFIGYPIWWDTTPPVVNTFMSAHDFSGKTVIPFCTSGGSGIRGSMANINRYCAGASILSGRDLTGANADTVRSWLNSIGMLP